MPYKRKKSAHRHQDVIPKTMTRTLVYERDICVPSNVSMDIPESMVSNLDSHPGFTESMSMYCPTYLAISANCPSDIFPNIPINASDGDDRLNFGSTMRPRENDGTVSDPSTSGDSAYTAERKIGMMQSLNWRRQVPMGWREAGKHYKKYRVMSSTVQIDLVPQPVQGSDSSVLTSDTVAMSVGVDKTTHPNIGTNWQMFLGQGSDAVTSVVSLHQQHFRMPGEIYRSLPSTNDTQRRINLKRIITAGTLHRMSYTSAANHDTVKDSVSYDPITNYLYYPPADTTSNFHRRWPKTKQVVIPAYVDKISPWSHPKKKHLFRASWRCPGKKDAAEREEYEAFLTSFGTYGSGATANVGDTGEGAQTDHSVNVNNDVGRTVPQREQFYILRLGGQDVVYQNVRDCLAQQSNHASHTFHVRVSYNVQFFERKTGTLGKIEETLDTTTDNADADRVSGASVFNNTSEDNGFNDTQLQDWEFGAAKQEASLH